MRWTISISYYDDRSGARTPIDISGSETLDAGKSVAIFWNLPILRRTGITRLTKLGMDGLVFFTGWGDIEYLRREIGLIEEIFARIDFDLTLKTEYLRRLSHSYRVLVESTPNGSSPTMMIASDDRGGGMAALRLPYNPALERTGRAERSL